MCQELGIPFKLLATAEPNGDYGKFLSANLEPHCQYSVLKDQILGQKCLKQHSGPCHVLVDPQLLVIGSPCNPFSRQNTSRFKPDAVEQHSLSAITFEEVFQAMKTFQPLTMLMEQSEGFGLPFDKNTEETPLSRPGHIKSFLSFGYGMGMAEYGRTASRMYIFLVNLLVESNVHGIMECKTNKRKACEAFGCEYIYIYVIIICM